MIVATFTIFPGFISTIPLFLFINKDHNITIALPVDAFA